MQALISHEHFDSNLLKISLSFPLVLNRFRFSALSYTFMRERILFNNSLSSFEEDPDGLDIKYNELSMRIENEITIFESNYQ